MKQNIRIAGFLSLGRIENDKRTGFDLYDIETKNYIELCSENKDENKLHFGHFYFNNAAFTMGKEILNPDKLTDKQLIVIDEIGPVELNGQGWSSSIENIARSIPVTQLWVVRKCIIKKITRRWNIGNIYIFDIKDTSVEEVENKIMEIISKQPDS